MTKVQKIINKSMRDNRPAELEAELLITSRLIKYKFNVTKPSFDKEGADLLIVDEIKGKTTKFLKIQSKLRTITDAKATYVQIPIEYVTDNFILFLYISQQDKNEELYTFFSEDIRKWRITNDTYTLTISKSSILKQLVQIFDKKTADKLRKRLNEQQVKEYVSIIIDGAFLEKAIEGTKMIYSKIWPEKKLHKPNIKDLIINFLYYNPFKNISTEINCILILSEHQGLETIVDVTGLSVFSLLVGGAKLSVYKTNQIISFKVLSELNRIINAENVILVADDPTYEAPLLELGENGIDLVVFKMKHDSGSRMYTKLRYQDIVYPLGRSMGLRGNEL